MGTNGGYRSVHRKQGEAMTEHEEKMIDGVLHYQRSGLWYPYSAKELTQKLAQAVEALKHVQALLDQMRVRFGT